MDHTMQSLLIEIWEAMFKGIRQAAGDLGYTEVHRRQRQMCIRDRGFSDWLYKPFKPVDGTITLPMAGDVLTVLERGPLHVSGTLDIERIARFILNTDGVG